MKTLVLLKEIYLEGFRNLGNFIIRMYFKLFAWFSFTMFFVVLYALVFRMMTGYAFDQVKLGCNCTAFIDLNFITLRHETEDFRYNWYRELLQHRIFSYSFRCFLFAGSNKHVPLHLVRPYPVADSPLTGFTQN